MAIDAGESGQTTAVEYTFQLATVPTELYPSRMRRQRPVEHNAGFPKSQEGLIRNR